MKKEIPEITHEQHFYMPKKVKKWGDSMVIVLTLEEREILGIKEGDVVGFRIQTIKKKGDRK